ncbi:unnamed protein product, partial [Oppiella nova]
MYTDRDDPKGPVSPYGSGFTVSHTRAIDYFIWSIDNKGKFSTNWVLDEEPGVELPVHRLKRVDIEAEMGYYADEHRFGDNIYGCLGLGPNVVDGLFVNAFIQSPQTVPELCHQKIRTFINGYHFVLAMNNENHIYGWGDNRWGQLGRDVTKFNTRVAVYSKPERISYFDDKDVQQISCGSHHSLALTSSGQVYGWGRHRGGEVGCGDNRVDIIFKPILIEFRNNAKMQTIYCCKHQSFAITCDGLVFSWGHKSGDQLHCVFTPQVISTLIGIKAIASSYRMTYLLTNTGFLYEWGNQIGDTPIKLESINGLDELPKHDSNRVFINPPVVLKRGKIFKISDTNELIETKYNNFIDFYANEYQMTYKTLTIGGVVTSSECKAIDNTIDTQLSPQLSALSLRCGETFDELSAIGSGGFGTVYQMRHKNDEFDETETENALKEVQNLVKVSSQYVVQYYHSWLEYGFLFIQMELCSQSLTQLLEVKAHVFERQSGDPMDLYEYFITCEIFRQILEAVHHLHGLDPPIIHRDLKPDNILIDTNAGNGRFIKLCDFGLATVHDKRVHYRTIQKHTADVGDLRYQAPEVARGEKYGIKPDIYSLGLIGGEVFDVNVALIDAD